MLRRSIELTAETGHFGRSVNIRYTKGLTGIFLHEYRTLLLRNLPSTVVKTSCVANHSDEIRSFYHLSIMTCAKDNGLNSELYLRSF
jgi:hypothetical protein